MRKRLLLPLEILILFFVGSSLALAKERVVKFDLPDIKNDFCGVEINHQFCKCGFHREFCKAVGLDKKGAEAHVNLEFQSWVKEKITNFAVSCVDGSGQFDSSKRDCTYCDNGSFSNGECVENVALVIGPFDAECNLTNEFRKDWKKYSDLDSRIRPQDGSFEASEYNRTLDEIANKIFEVENIEYQMEMDRLLRLEMKEYKKALVNNIKSNLTKAIFRLSWLTYNTVMGASGPGYTYSQLFTEDSTVKQIGAAMKFVQSGVPKGSKAEIDGKTRMGRIKAGAWNATLEVLESGGDPKAIALQVYSDGVKAVASEYNLPSIEFSEEEIGILRDQHLTNQAIDELIADSYKENSLRRKRALLLSLEIEKLYAELQSWKRKEYERVEVSLVDQCKTGGR